MNTTDLIQELYDDADLALRVIINSTSSAFRQASARQLGDIAAQLQAAVTESDTGEVIADEPAAYPPPESEWTEKPAPELLEVLEDIISDTGTSGYWWGEKARAALSKAKGETP